MANRRISLESLRILEACVAHASFTRAAEEFCLTPAAVSLRIRTLEADLGEALFTRSGPRVEPTEAAKVLAARLGKVFRDLESAVDDSRGAAMPIRLTAPPTFAARWLTAHLATYQSDPHAVPIELDVSTQVQASTAFDVSIRTGHGDWPGLDAAPLLPVEATPMLSPTLATSCPSLTLQALAELPLLPHPDWQRWFKAAGGGALKLRFAKVEYPSHELNAEAAISGQGVALLSPMLFGVLLASGNLIRPFGCVLTGPAWHYVLTHAGEQRAAVLQFRAWLLEETQSGDPATRHAAVTP